MAHLAFLAAAVTPPASTSQSVLFIGACSVGGVAFGAVWPHYLVLASEIFGSEHLSKNYMFFDGVSGAIGSLCFANLLPSTIYVALTLNLTLTLIRIPPAICVALTLTPTLTLTLHRRSTLWETNASARSALVQPTRSSACCVSPPLGALFSSPPARRISMRRSQLQRGGASSPCSCDRMLGPSVESERRETSDAQSHEPFCVGIDGGA